MVLDNDAKRDPVYRGGWSAMIRPLRVLYVDDEPDLLDIGRMFLEGSGDFSVKTALSAPDAIRLLEGEQFDAIVSDYQMPGMDGIQFLVEVRSRFGLVPFILFTGKGREEVVIQAINNGVDFYLQKGGEPQAQFAELVHQVKQAASRKRAEDALREREELFKSLVHNSSDLTILTDAKGIVTYVSPQCEHVIGHHGDKFVGKTMPDIIYPDDVPRCLHAWEQVTQHGQELREFEYRILDSQGAVRWISHSAKLTTVDGRVLGMQNTIRDITGPKKAEETLIRNTEDLHSAYEELTASEEELQQNVEGLARSEQVLQTRNAYNRSLIEASLDSLVTINPDGRIADVNSSTEKITGYSRDELIGTDFSDYFTEPEQAKEGYQRVFTDGTVRDYPLSIRHRDGHITPVLYNATVYRDEIGNVGGVFAAARDITERKRAEEALRESEEKYRNLFMTGADGIVVHDAQGRNIDVNAQACEMLGYSHDELLAMRVSDLIPLEELQRKPPRLTEVLAGQPVCYERKLRRKDGTLLDLEIRASRVTEGTVQAFWRDITGRKRAEEALHQANKKLTLLSSLTRHDINNQLTVQMGYLSMLEKKQFDPTQAEYFQKVSTAADRISAMIRFTKEYEDIGVNAPAWQDCRSLVDTAAKEAPLGKVMVKNDLPAGAEVFADPLVVRVFYNLMDNAMRYGGKITTLRFSAVEHDGNKVLVCEDDGIGILAEEKEMIFDRGFGKNTGMGLFLAREILDITGISIRETGDPGRGARFELTVREGAWRNAGKED